MGDDLVDAAEQVLVQLAAQVERGGAERRGVHPCPGLRRHHRPAVHLGGGGRPPRLRDVGPAPALALEAVGEAVARDGGRRLAVALDPEGDASGGRPALQRNHEPFLEELRQRAVVVRPEPRRLGSVGGQLPEHRERVVPAPGPELVEHSRRPVRAVHLEAVAEHRVEQLRTDRGDQRVADRLDVLLGRPRRVVIEDGTLGSRRRPLDVLAGEARHRRQHDARTPARRQGDDAVGDLEGLEAFRRLLQGPLPCPRRHELVVGPRARQGQGGLVGTHLLPVPVQPPRRGIRAHVRTAERPAAAEGHVEGQSHGPAPARRRSAGRRGRSASRSGRCWR